MDGMSETRKAIMARLGFAAGKKAAFAITKEQIRGASREELRSIEQRLMELAKSGDKNAAALLAYVEEEYNDRYRGTHSRPGAKAAMAKFKVGDRVAYKPHPANTVGELVEIRKPTSLEGVEMQYGIKQASGSIMWVPEGMLVRASRPGAKAKMARTSEEYAEDVQNASALISQWSQALKAALIAENYRDARSIVGKMSQTASALEKELSRPIAKMSRPGVKAKMGRAEQVMRDGSVHLDFRAAKEWLSAASEAELRYIVKDARAAASANPDGKKWNYYHDLAITASEMLAKRMKASRPGAKAKFSNGDKNRRLMQVLADADRRIANQVVSNIAAHYGIATQQVFDEIFDAEAEDLMDYLTEPVRSAAFVILKKKGMMSRPGAKATAAKADDKTECADCETEQDKAGLKLMEKADKAVSDKIRTLIKEGKPQDQAVAIALDMKRRGEL